jgi:hypothetical protein
VAYLTNQAIYDTTLSITSNFLSHLVCGIELDCSYREVLVGIEHIESNEIAVYPNPAHEFIYLSNPLQPVYYSVYDVFGRYVDQGYSTQLATQTWSDGLYVVKTSSDSHSFHSTTILVNHE